MGRWILKTFFADVMRKMSHLQQEYERIRIELGETKRNWVGIEGDLAELRARRMGLWK